MTENEFNMCCHLFVAKYDGNYICNIVDDFNRYNIHIIDKKTVRFEWNLNRIYFTSTSDKYHFFYEKSTKSINYLKSSGSYYVAYTSENFLNHFKIPFKDIV